MRRVFDRFIDWLFPQSAFEEQEEPEIVLIEKTSPSSRPESPAVAAPEAEEPEALRLLRDEISASMRQLRSLELALETVSSQLPTLWPLSKEIAPEPVSCSDAASALEFEDIRITVRG